MRRGIFYAIQGLLIEHTLWPFVTLDTKIRIDNHLVGKNTADDVEFEVLTSFRPCQIFVLKKYKYLIMMSHYTFHFIYQVIK